MVTGSIDHTAKIWDLKTRRHLLHTLVGHTDWVESIAISGNRVVTGARDRTAKIWDLKTGELLYTLSGDWADSVAISGNRVITGGNLTARIWHDTRPRERALAFACALHPRLGIGSPAYALSQPLMYELGKLIMEDVFTGEEEHPADHAHENNSATTHNERSHCSIQ